MDNNVKIKLNNTALRAISILVICVAILMSTILVINSRAEDRKAEVINNCFNVASYTGTNEENHSAVKEPVIRFFKTCMEFNGYGSNYTFLTE